MPENVREAAEVGPFRVLVAGLLASELPPCTGRCPPPKMTLALVDSSGTVCWRTDLPAEYRRGPVGRVGRAIFVAGQNQVFAVSFSGKLLASTKIDGPRLGPVLLKDGGAVFVDTPGYLVTFRVTGQPRWRRKPKALGAALAISDRPEGGVAAAYSSEVRCYDPDGVPMFTVVLPDRATRRGIGVAGRSLWVWSHRGAYRIAERKIRWRVPPRAPKDGQVFAGRADPRGLFYAILAEQGFYPVKLVAAAPNDVLRWSRPYTGARPKGCTVRVARSTELGILCTDGRGVVRDRAGITRFDETAVKRLVLGPRGRFAVATEFRTRDMTQMCRVRRYAAAGESFKTREVKGKCRVLWIDDAEHVYLGARKLF